VSCSSLCQKHIKASGISSTPNHSPMTQRSYSNFCDRAGLTKLRVLLRALSDTLLGYCIASCQIFLLLFVSIRNCVTTWLNLSGRALQKLKKLVTLGTSVKRSQATQTERLQSNQTQTQDSQVRSL
jgi:hypothetical protein